MSYPKGFYVQDSINIDYDKAKGLGYKYCIARAADCDQISDGSPYEPSNYVDQQFSAEVAEADRVGMYLFAWYRLGMVPNVHAVDWKTPGAGLQYKALRHALKNKTYHAIIVALTSPVNTGSNMMEYLNQFVGVIETCKMQEGPSSSGSAPAIIVACSPQVWWAGNKEVENTIGQANYKNAVMVIGSMDQFLSPGNLVTSNNVFWANGYTKDLGDMTYTYDFFGTEDGLKTRYGEVINYDYMPDDEPGNEPGNEPGSGINVDLSGVISALGNINDKLDNIDRGIRRID